MNENELRTRNILIKEISDKINRNKLSLYLGAGVSIPSNIPGWNTIVNECCGEMKINLNKSEENYYKLLEYYAIEYGRKAIIRKFIRHFDKANLENDTLQALSKLNFNKIWTTNFDNVIRDYLTENFIASNIINSDESFINILGNEGISIIKLNGDFESEHQIITEQDYFNYELNFKNLYLNFQAELCTHSFLIIGSSLSDGLFLPTLYKLFKGEKPPHTSYVFCRIPINEDEKTLRRFSLNCKYLKEMYNIESILFDNDNDVPKIINQLQDICSHNHCFISGSLPQRKREEQAALEDNAREFFHILVKKLMLNKIKIYTCFGMLIGNYISFPVTSHCIKNGESVNKYLQTYPLDNRMSANDMANFRNKIINRAKYFIAIGGKESNESGVYKEFLIAKDLHKIIIPIPLLGGCGKLIYEEIQNDSGSFPYLKIYLNALNSKDLNTVADTVLEIILKTKGNQYI